MPPAIRRSAPPASSSSSPDSTRWTASAAASSMEGLSTQCRPERVDLSFQPSHRPSQLVPVMFDQSVGHRLQVAADDLVQLVKGQADAVVGEAIVGEVIGPDLVAPVPAADHRFALGRALRIRFLLVVLVEPRFED